MEWFDFGVYGFVAYALAGSSPASPGVQMIAALATFSVPFTVRPLGGLFFGAMGDKFGRQRCSRSPLSSWRSAPSVSADPSYASIGIWAPILLLLASWRRASPSAVNIPVRQFSSPNTRRTANAALWAAGWTSAPSPAL